MFCSRVVWAMPESPTTSASGLCCSGEDSAFRVPSCLNCVVMQFVAGLMWLESPDSAAHFVLKACFRSLCCNIMLLTRGSYTNFTSRSTIRPQDLSVCSVSPWNMELFQRDTTVPLRGMCRQHLATSFFLLAANLHIISCHLATIQICMLLFGSSFLRFLHCPRGLQHR